MLLHFEVKMRTLKTNMPIKKITSAFLKPEPEPKTLGYPKGLGARARPDAHSSVRALGSVRKKLIQLAPFESLEVDIPIDVFWRPSNEQFMIIQLPESFLKYLVIELSGRKLFISSKAGLMGGRIQCWIFGSKLMEVHIASSAQVQLQDIEAGRLIVSVRDSAQLQIQGEVSEAHYEAHDHGCIDALSTGAQIAVVESYAESMVLCKTKEALQAHIHQRSTLVNLGNPKIIDVQHFDDGHYLTVGKEQ